MVQRARGVEQGSGTNHDEGASAAARTKRLKQRGELICLNDIVMNGKIWDIIY